MPDLPLNLLVIVTMGLAFTTSVDSMRFELASGATKCVSDDIKSNTLSVGRYSIIPPTEGIPLPHSYQITVRVTSPYSNSYHFADRVEVGNFAFTAAESGDYTACFSASDHRPPFTVAVDFDWRTGVAAKDWSMVAKKGQLQAMEVELKRLYDTVVSIHDEMFHLRERDEEMQQLNRATNSKMTTFSFLSIAVCLSVAGLQLWHLKTFFERKKLL